jgi:LEA14-like dessication related protein
MSKVGISIICFIAVVLTAAGCASKGAPVVKPPTAEVSSFNSTVITPQVVKFQAKVLIHNRASDSLNFERVDYAVDLHEQELFTYSFEELKRTRGRGSQTVTFPFQIAMADIMNQGAPILAEGSMLVTFRGTVYPDRASGYAPVPFRSTVSIPIPEIPIITLAGTEGVPLTDEFVLRLRVKNTNSFSIAIRTVDSYLEVNQVQYELLHTEDSTELEPGDWGIVSLSMENSTNKTLSLAINLLQSPDAEFRLGGVVECTSPYGWIVIPLNIQNEV